MPLPLKISPSYEEILTQSNTFSLSPSDSASQTAFWSGQPFMHSWRHTVPIPYNGSTPSKNCPLPMGDLEFHLKQPKSTTQTPSRSVQPFLQGSRHTLQWAAHFSQNLPLPMNGSWLHLIIVHWAHPSPQLKRHLDRFSHFLQGSLYSDSPTDR